MISIRAERTLGHLLLLLCASALTAAHEPSTVAPPTSGAQRAMEQGLRLYQQDRSSLEAQRLLDQASLRFPEQHGVHLALLDSYLVRGNVAAAAALLRRVRPELDSSDRFAFDATYYLLQHRQPALAREEWLHVHDRLQARARERSRPPTPKEQGEDLFLQGLLAAATHNKDEAMRLLHLADTHGFPPFDSRQMLMLADTLYELGEVRLAAPTYEEFLKHWPADSQARLHLALALHASGELPPAVQQLERVLREQPRLQRASYTLGAVLFDLKRTDEAKARLEDELKLDPRCYPCMAKLAHIAYLTGDGERCRSWLDKAAALDPAWAETDLVYGMLEIRAAKYQSAIRHLSKVIEQFPDHIQAHYHLQIAYRRSGNAEKAVEHAQAFKRLTQAQKAQGVGQQTR
jgi:tetratricopeptide (TPR) repeat protein